MAAYSNDERARELNAEIEVILGNPPPEEPLDPQWDLAITALMAQPTIVRAAEVAGISERTLRRWLANPPFRRAYREECRRVLATATSRLVGLLGPATEALGRALTCGVPAVEARAALDVFKLVADGVRVEDLGARLDALEREGQDNG